MVIRTTENVKNFSDLRISYLLKLYETTEIRRKSLLKDYYFFCECNQCLDVISDQIKSSLKCNQCSGCVPTTIGICMDCNVKMDNSLIIEHRFLRKEILNYTSEDEPLKKEACNEKLYNRALEIFHPYDIDFLELLNFFCTQQLDGGNLPKSLDLLRTSLPMVNILFLTKLKLTYFS